MRKRLRGRFAAVMLTSLVAALALTATASAATVVRATAAFEWLPVHSGKFLAWTQRPTAGSPDSSNRVMVRIDGNTAFSIGSAESYSGGISGNILVYQRVVNDTSSIRFYNMTTRTSVAAPPEVNVNGTEGRPSLFGDLNTGFLLFERDNSTGGENVVLLNLKNHHSKVLFSANTVDPGQINGTNDTSFRSDFASYSHCGGITCDVHVYRFNPANFTNGVTHSANFNADANRRGPSVTKSGTAYLVRNTGVCGSSATLSRLPWGASVPHSILSFPAGVDSFHTYVDDTGATTKVFFDRHPCGGDSDLWSVNATQ